MKIDNYEDFKLLDIDTIKKLSNVIGVKYEYLKGNDLDIKRMTLYNIIQESYQETAISFLNNTTVGVSYSSVNKNIMFSVCNCLEKNNFRIYTDLTNISDTNGIISAFERKLAQQNVFLALISTDYLKSEHCMYELYYNYIYNHLNIDNIVQHTILLCIKKTDLGNDAILKLHESWKKKKDELNELFNVLRDVNKQSLGERIGRVDNIYFHFTEIVNILKDINMVTVDPDNVQECIPKLLQKINDITIRWE